MKSDSRTVYHQVPLDEHSAESIEVLTRRLQHLELTGVDPGAIAEGPAAAVALTDPRPLDAWQQSLQNFCTNFSPVTARACHCAQRIQVSVCSVSLYVAGDPPAADVCAQGLV